MLPIIVVIVAVTPVTAIETGAGFEVRTAAAVNPDAAVIVAPGLTENAGCFAALAK